MAKKSKERWHYGTDVAMCGAHTLRWVTADVTKINCKKCRKLLATAEEVQSEDR